MSSTRRSTRSTAKRNLPEALKDASDDEFVAQLEADEPTRETKTRGKKRKASTKRTQIAKSRRKKVKVTTCGELLSSLQKLPNELLSEIFSYLNPVDLVHLARTSKDLRVLLMSQFSSSTWVMARSNVVPALPDCPDDFHEPAYAELVFCKSCHYCGRMEHASYYAWSVRRRICSKCIRKRCKRPHLLKLKNYTFPTEKIQDVLPHMSVYGNAESDNLHHGTYFFVEYLTLWEDGYKRAMTARTKTEWLDSQYEAQKKRNDHGKLCEIWFAEYKTNQESERKMAVRKRVGELEQWKDELAMMDPSELTFPKLCSADEAINRKWSTLDPKINIYMKEVKERRLEKDRLLMIEARLSILQEVLTEQLSNIAIVSRGSYPTAAELFAEPLIQDIIKNTPANITFTKEHLAPSVAAIFPGAIRRLRLRAQDQLYELMRLKNFPGGVSDRDVLFNLATTVFQCFSKSCLQNLRHRYCWFEDILHHRCTKNLPFPEEFPESDIIQKTFGKGFRSHADANDVIYSGAIARLVVILVNLCGLDPLDTTKDTMDTLYPIFECVACNDIRKGRAAMTWTTMVQHYFDHHRKVEPQDLNILLLGGSEAVESRKRISELHLRKTREDSRNYDLNGQHVSRLACAHCGEAKFYTHHWEGFGWKFVLSHMADKHGIEVVTDEDTVSNPDADHIPPIYYIWPPRYPRGMNA